MQILRKLIRTYLKHDVGFFFVIGRRWPVSWAWVGGGSAELLSGRDSANSSLAAAVPIYDWILSSLVDPHR